MNIKESNKVSYTNAGCNPNSSALVNRPVLRRVSVIINLLQSVLNIATVNQNNCAHLLEWMFC